MKLALRDGVQVHKIRANLEQPPPRNFSNAATIELSPESRL